MAEEKTYHGTVKWFSVERRYGFITWEGKGDMFVHINQWKGPEGSHPRKDQRVDFEVGPGQKGKLEAKNARPAGMEPVEPTRKKRREAPPTEPGEYRFLNPYNFVRPLPKSRPEGHVLGDAPPPPHDRYIDSLLTGRVTCKVTAVMPLFVSDSHEIKGKSGEHRSFRFFEYGSDPALPASSLRGMVRSVFEAVTNSCFSVFDPARLDYREARIPKGVVPARVVEVNEDGARLEILDATRERPMNVRVKRKRNGRLIYLLNSAMVSAYEPQVLDTDTMEVFNTGESILPADAHEGMRVAALVDLNTESKGVYQYFRAYEVVPIDQHDELVTTNGKRKVFGYLHITGPNIEKKHFERLFFRWDDPGSERVSWEQIPRKYQVTISKDVVEEYNAHLKEYWDRNKRQVSKLGEEPWPVTPSALPHPSDFIQKGRKLRAGDLVYYVPDTSLGIPLVRPVSIFRQPFKFSRGKLLQEHTEYLNHCTEYSHLCPACRVFGWVRQMERDEDVPSEERTAYAGRVRLSHGTPVEGKVWQDDRCIPLSILSTPKPTTTQFYLMKNRRPDGHVDYDDPSAQLRGRKFYRHHGKEPSKDPDGKYEYRQFNDVQNEQNRTVRNVVKEDSEFTFDVEFENLHPLELGALLWSLELEDGMHHRLGYGKPLGFGSVTVEVTALKVMDSKKRYVSLSSSGWENRLMQKNDWVELFRKAMQSEYPEAFDDMLAELRALLSDPTIEAIHYPRPSEERKEDGENFKWFMENKDRDRPIPLSLATEDRGLPIKPKRSD